MSREADFPLVLASAFDEDLDLPADSRGLLARDLMFSAMELPST